MKILDTETQAGLFAASAAVGAVLKRRAPDAVRELAAIGFIVSAVAPSYEEVSAWQRSAGLPLIDQGAYEEAVAAALDFANAAFAPPDEVQH